MGLDIRNNKPPVIFEFLLRSLSKDIDPNERLGDYEEIYNLKITESGKIYGKSWYLLQICRLFKNIIIYSISRSVIMFNNYLKIALRN
ncbi:MAG: hypothetical protein GY863_00850, partial [bacterium]|nr:hypothetical protein [bacterium]